MRRLWHKYLLETKQRIEYVEGESSKGSKVTNERDLVNQQFNQQEDLNKEVPNQPEQPKEVKKQFN